MPAAQRKALNRKARKENPLGREAERTFVTPSDWKDEAAVSRTGGARSSLKFLHIHGDQNESSWPRSTKSEYRNICRRSN